MSIPQVPLTPLQVVFTLTDGRLPFRTDGTGNEQLPGLLETIPKPLLVRLARWNQETAAAYDWAADEFGSKTRRQEAAHEYAALAEQLWSRHLDVRLEMWC